MKTKQGKFEKKGIQTKLDKPKMIITKIGEFKEES